jgi:hypothetical protein
MNETKTIRRTRVAGTAAWALAALLLAAPAARADWLVTRAGARVETQGAWKVKGKLVVFTQRDGTLASLRLAEVDLAASERATAEVKTEPAAPSTPAEPAKKKSRIVLTDADFQKKSEEADVAAGATAAAAADTAGQAQTVSPQGQEGDTARQSPVVVASWRQAQRTEGDGIDIFGVLQNTANTLATNVSLTVELFNEAGQSLGSGPAVLSAPGLRPQGSITFRASFPGVFSFTEARFDVKSRSVALTPVTESDQGGAAETGQEKPAPPPG